ncbi:MAG: sensor histidine kinase [Rhodothalassiaceae bacterium]
MAHRRNTFRRRWRGSLQGRITLLLTLALLPLGVVAVGNTVLSYGEYHDALEAAVVEAAGAIADAQADMLTDAGQLLDRLATQSTPAWLVSGSCPEALRGQLDRAAQIYVYTGADETARTLCMGTTATAQTPPPALSQLSTASGLPLDRPRVLALPERDAVALAVRMPAHGDRPEAVLAMTIGLSALRAAVRGIDRPPDTAVALLDSRSQPIITTRGPGFGPDWLPQPMPPVAGSRADSLIWATGQDGVRRRYLVKPALDGAGTILVALTPHSAGALARFLVFSGAALPLIMWLVALVTASLALNGQVVRPLCQVGRVMIAYAADGADRRVRLKRGLPDELALLGRQFNAMADTLEKHDQSLNAMLEQQTRLVREVHHRTKNNLQIISSLISILARRAEDSDGKSDGAALAEIQRWVDALGFVHHELYQSDDFRTVDLGAMLEKLVARQGQVEGAPVLEARCAPAAGTMDAAVPLALLTAELLHQLSTAGQDARGRVRVDFQAQPPDFVMTLSSDSAFADTVMAADAARFSGAGLAEGFARQLSGQLTAAKDGRQLTLRFPIRD